MIVATDSWPVLTVAGAVPVPDSDGVAVVRERFLNADLECRMSHAGEADRLPVRSPILASWHRSREWAVRAEKAEARFYPDFDPDTALTRCAEPVLQRLVEQLTGHAVSIVLTDPTGLVLNRRAGDAVLDRHLDGVLLAPGYSYAEEFVGTNGIGTALEAGSPTEVFGHEHYAENLEDLACAAAPIHHPVSGRLVGVVDLTCWRRDAESLLLTLASTTAEQIQHGLLVSSGLREYEVLQAYRQTCRRNNGIVFALTSGDVVLNASARAELVPIDQAALLAHANETAAVLSVGRRRTQVVTLPSGVSARMHCQQVGFGNEPAGLVVHVKLEHPGVATPRQAETTMLLPGLVGGAPLWQRACREVEGALAERVWIALEGEPGVGKLSLLRAAQRRGLPSARSAVLDAALCATEPDWLPRLRRSLAEADVLLITHADELDAVHSRAVGAALADARANERRPPWVAMTRRPDRDVGALLDHFPTSVAVPPLRLRLEDIPALTSFFLAKFGKGGHLACAPETQRRLMRSSWPGNVTELHDLLHDVVQRRRVGVIEADDLPPAMSSISRRVLSTIESMERDAIVQSLTDAGGNKVQAARALGMSRATIYRKIHEFGIVPTS